MRGAIIDLDRSASPTRGHPADRLAITALTLACLAFSLVVWTGRPAPTSSSIAATNAPGAVFLPGVAPRGIVLHPLQLPPGHSTVDLAALPERLANEQMPWTLRNVVTVRGSEGVASVEGPAQVVWTEGGIVYWLRASDGTIADLIRLADELR